MAITISTHLKYLGHLTYLGYLTYLGEKVNDLNYFNFETSNIIEILFLSVKHLMCAKNNT